MADCTVAGCNVEETGVCALHNIEVERRKNTEKVIEAIPGLVKFMHLTIGGLIVISVIGLAVVSGFAWYVNKTTSSTYKKVEEQAQAQKEHEDKYSKKFERTTREVSELASKMDTYTDTNQQFIEEMRADRAKAWGLIEKYVEKEQYEEMYRTHRAVPMPD